jgi:hypothetical protein
MSIFSLFNQNAVVPRTDLVWINRDAKLKGTLDYLSKNRADLCVSWFEETQSRFKHWLNEENHLNIEIKMAEFLVPYHLDNKCVIFLEHNPVYSGEAKLLSEIKASQLCFLNSLDDPLFQIFGDSIAKLMRSLGIAEDQYIEHKMVSKAVINAQKKVEKNIRDIFYARSGAEWLQQYRIFYQSRIK